MTDVLISWCLSESNENTPFINADEYWPFKLQLISFFKNFEPLDKINVSETLFFDWSILLYEYFILLFCNLSILKGFKIAFSYNLKL